MSKTSSMRIDIDIDIGIDESDRPAIAEGLSPLFAV
ncbi:hypothetical protein BH23ACT3_BH23ACT3_03340 [soil metagenome]